MNSKKTLRGCGIFTYGLAIAVLSTHCSSTYDTTDIQNPVRPDPIDDSAPAVTQYDNALDYQNRVGATSNNSTQRFRFDVVPYADDSEKQAAEVLYPSHAAFLQAHDSRGTVLPSVQTVVTYTKQLDDTIYAGVEHTVEQGLMPTVESKRAVLRGALAYLTAHRSADADEAFAVVAAAARLGGDQPAIPSDLAATVDSLQSEFLANAAEAKPIGFYTWSDELKGIWQQDRLLQRALPTPGATCALASAIAADSGLRTQYENLVELYSRLTNPVKSSLLDLLAAASTGNCLTNDSAAFLSASETPETELFDRLYPDGVPPNADLMGDLIAAIRNGTVDLTPTAADGWYGYQLYALETLLVTDKSEERIKVGFTGRYKKRLQEAFSTLLVQHRETHVKQADQTSTDSAFPTPPPTPSFRVEPLATVYVRHARSYVFLEQALDRILGAGALDSAVAVGQAGPEGETLRQRIRRARDLFYGLYLVSTEDLGFEPALSVAGDPSPDTWTALAHAADAWLLELASDPLAKSDVRVMVPIADLGEGKYKYWAVIGVRATLAGYSFISNMDMSPPPNDQVGRAWLPTEQFLEVTSSAVPLSRDELRALCDQQKTAERIQAALETR